MICNFKPDFIKIFSKPVGAVDTCLSFFYNNRKYCRQKGGGCQPFPDSPKSRGKEGPEKRMENGIQVKNGKELRCGYTTGTCAAAAAAAAAQMLLTQQDVQEIKVLLPRGEELFLPVERISYENGRVSCGIVKFSGDDPDVTDGITIFAEVSREKNEGIRLLGGKGVGIVTAPGLQIQPGEPAINPVPRKMIQENVERICRQQGYAGGLSVTISAENGEEIAKKTFNPRLGIVGGISILGTTGIVEPMSEQALIDTIHVLIDKARVQDSKRVIISPGNYGRDYCLKHFQFDLESSVKFSNYIGETLDYLVYRGFEKALLVGHIGKMVKLAAGIMNTHSAVADGRMEVLAVHSMLCGAPPELVPRIMACRTTDEAIALLDQWGNTQSVMDSVLKKILEHIGYRTRQTLKMEILIFSTGDRIMAKTGGVEKLIEEMRK